MGVATPNLSPSFTTYSVKETTSVFLPANKSLCIDEVASCGDFSSFTMVNSTMSLGIASPFAAATAVISCNKET
ncbi:hypothetical protein D3C72_1974860 [compost metagenome]